LRGPEADHNNGFVGGIGHSETPLSCPVLEIAQGISLFMMDATKFADLKATFAAIGQLVNEDMPRVLSPRDLSARWARFLNIGRRLPITASAIPNTKMNWPNPYSQRDDGTLPALWPAG